LTGSTPVPAIKLTVLKSDQEFVFVANYVVKLSPKILHST